jgi:hypothetical protein
VIAMTSRELSAGQLRYHLQELSVALARRLVAVLGAARDAPHGVAAELDAIVSEITDIQRDLAYEMAGPQLTGAADLTSLARMLELQRRMMRLMDRLETISSRPITTYLEEHQPTPRGDQSGWTALSGRPSLPYYGETLPQYALPATRTWEEPHQVSVPAHEILHQRVTHDSHAAGTAPFLARSLGAHGSAAGSGAVRWPHISPAARWGILPMAICVVSALLTATVNRLMQGSDTPSILQLSESVAKRGDRLDAGATSQERAQSSAELTTARPSTGAQKTQRIAIAPAAVQPATITVSPPAPNPDRGLDALNPDAPSVAVLATHQDAAVAEQTFAKLKQRYPAILGNAEAELEAIETQDGATWHRLSLIPPVPRSEAKDLCKRLRAAGYAGCWVRSRAGE